MAGPAQNLQELVPHPAYRRWTPSSDFLADLQTAKDVGSAMGSVVIQIETPRLLVGGNSLGHKAIDYIVVFINGVLTARRPDRHFEPCSSLA